MIEIEGYSWLVDKYADVTQLVQRSHRRGYWTHHDDYQAFKTLASKLSLFWWTYIQTSSASGCSEHNLEYIICTAC